MTKFMKKFFKLILQLKTHYICKKFDIKNYTINDDMSISIDGNVNLLRNYKLSEIPIKFKEVTGHFDCGHNALTSLKNCPEKVGGYFYCSYNKLTSLEGCPKYISSGFYCDHNKLTSLEGCPKRVDEHFSCENNNLILLKGPEYIGGQFWCVSNQITNFDGLPEFFEQSISIDRNPVDEIYRLFKCDPRCIYYLRDYDVIRGNKVIRDRLDEVFHTLDMEVPKDIQLMNYILV